MSTHLVRAALDDVRSRLQVLGHFDDRKRDGESGEARWDLRATSPSIGGRFIEFTIDARQVDTGTAVRIRARSAGLLRRGFIASGAIALGLMTALPVLVHRGMTWFANSVTGTSPLLWALGIGVLVLPVVWIWGEIGRRIKRADVRLGAILGAPHFSSEVINKASPSPTEEGFVHVLFGIGLATIAQMPYWPLWVVVLPVYAVDVVTALPGILFSEIGYLRWKSEVSRVLTTPARAVFPLLMFFAMAPAFAIAQYALLQMPRAGFTRQRVLIQFSSPLSVQPPVANMPALEPTDRMAPHAGDAILLLKLGMAFLAALCCVLAFSYVRESLRVPQEWLEDTNERRVLRWLPSMNPSNRSSVTLTNAHLWLTFTVLATSSWAGVYLLSEVVTRLATGTNLTSYMTSVLDWLLLAPASVEHVWSLRALNAVILVALAAACVPFAIVGLAGALSAFRGQPTARGRAAARASVPEGLQRFVVRSCAQVGIPAAEVVLQRAAAPAAWSDHPLLARPRIVLTDGLLATLDGPELEAVLAHEVGHLKLHWPWIRILRLLSAGTLTCPNLLILTQDFPRGELQADRFAVTLTGDRGALERAILKCSMGVAGMNHARGAGQSVARTALRARLAGAYSFFFAPALVGHTYPSLANRVRAIRGQS